MDILLILEKIMVARKRPYINFENIINKDFIQYSKYDSQFYSGHTMFCLILSHQILQLPYSVSILLSFIVGLSRVNLGVHYPSDCFTSIFIYMFIFPILVKYVNIYYKYIY